MKRKPELETGSTYKIPMYHNLLYTPSLHGCATLHFILVGHIVNVWRCAVFSLEPLAQEPRETRLYTCGL